MKNYQGLNNNNTILRYAIEYTAKNLPPIFQQFSKNNNNNNNNNNKKKKKKKKKNNNNNNKDIKIVKEHRKIQQKEHVNVKAILD